MSSTCLEVRRRYYGQEYRYDVSDAAGVRLATFSSSVEALDFAEQRGRATARDGSGFSVVQVRRSCGSTSYQVIGPEGDVVASLSTLDLARRSADRHARRAATKLRKCMTCDIDIMSHGPGHRRCDGCRRLSDFDGRC